MCLGAQRIYKPLRTRDRNECAYVTIVKGKTGTQTLFQKILDTLLSYKPKGLSSVYDSHILSRLSRC